MVYYIQCMRILNVTYGILHTVYGILNVTYGILHTVYGILNVT